jgi:hypothetical protein
MDIAHQSPANAKDHGGVALHQRGEGGFVTGADEFAKELAVSQTAAIPEQGCPAQLGKAIQKRTGTHDQNSVALAPFD